MFGRRLKWMTRGAFYCRRSLTALRGVPLRAAGRYCLGPGAAMYHEATPSVPSRPEPREASPGRPLRRTWRGRGMRVSTRLLLIIAVCLVPGLALQLGIGWAQWAERKAQVGDLAVRQA